MPRTLRTYDITTLPPIEWVEVPYYANGVRAGVPTSIGDLCEETICIPRAFASACSYVVPVRGQSMRDFDLREGDELYHQALIGNISYSSIPTTRLREMLNEHLAANFGYENIRKYRRDI